jgi:glutamate-1-semialdehyde 2,1-aminomutase
MSERYAKSEKMLERSEKVIPLGSQTFSKSKKTFPVGVSPLFLKTGHGAISIDADGNEFVDYLMGLCSINLGYNYLKLPENETPSLSLSSEIEIEVAEKICELVPCAEMVRFGKNGSDATAGAIRLARAYTKRDYIAKCYGHYHGYQDWSIWDVNDLGIPKAVQELTLHFDYNNIESLHKLFKEYPNQIAAVIMEPMNYFYPEDKFLHKAKELCEQNGALFILDEVITGFRASTGGTQELFNIIPHLCCLGKGLANGYPLSAVAGQTEYMRLLEDVHFSFTFGGERLSLFAAQQTMDIIEKENVCLQMYHWGNIIIDETTKLIDSNSLNDVMIVMGLPQWSHIIFYDYNGYKKHEIKALFMQECMKRGILTLGSHNMCKSHEQYHVNKLLSVYKEVFGILDEAVNHNKLQELLKVKIEEPKTKVR